jgi:hypothetical protein
MKGFRLLLVAACAAALPAAPALADCTSPAGPAGRMDYFPTENVLKYCDGTNWTLWAGQIVSGADPTFIGSGGGSGGTPAGNEGEIQFNSNGLFSASNDLLWDNTNGRLGIKDNTPDVELDVAGDIHYTGTLTDVSDIRLKQNIRPLRGSLQKISRLNGISFQMKNGLSRGRELGLSAQDVQQVFPELVHTDTDEAGTLSVNYIGLIAPMIEAIKELQAENARLEARLEQLESRRP